MNNQNATASASSLTSSPTVSKTESRKYARLTNGVPYGLATAEVTKDGRVALGFALCHSKLDTFDRKEAARIALERMNSNKFVVNPSTSVEDMHDQIRDLFVNWNANPKDKRPDREVFYTDLGDALIFVACRTSKRMEKFRDQSKA